MAYNMLLAERIAAMLTDKEIKAEEKKMFGGIAFMVNGHMMVGVTKDDMMVRTTSEKYESALKKHHARPMDFTGKAMHGFLFVSGPPLLDHPALMEEFLDLGWEYVNSPAAAEAAAKKAKKKK